MILSCCSIIKTCEPKDWLVLVLCFQFVLVVLIKLMNQKIDWHPSFDIAAVKKMLYRVYYLSMFCLYIVFSKISPHCYENSYKCIQFLGYNILQFFWLCHLSYWKQRMFYEMLQCRFLPPLFLLMNSWNASEINKIFFQSFCKARLAETVVQAFLFWTTDVLDLLRCVLSVDNPQSCLLWQAGSCPSTPSAIHRVGYFLDLGN